MNVSYDSKEGTEIPALEQNDLAVTNAGNAKCWRTGNTGKYLGQKTFNARIIQGTRNVCTLRITNPEIEIVVGRIGQV